MSKSGVILPFRVGVVGSVVVVVDVDEAVVEIWRYGSNADMVGSSGKVSQFPQASVTPRYQDLLLRICEHALNGLVNSVQTMPMEKIWMPEPDM